MLIFIGILAVVIITASAISVFNLRGEFENKISLVALLFGPLIDGILSFLVANFFELNKFSSLMVGLSLGLISLILLQPLLIPSRLVIWRMAWNNVIRHKRQTALLISGLMIASSVITSSLVIGDSLDDTISWQVDEIWQDTDLVIQGFDPFTGTRVLFDESFGHEVWNGLVDADEPVRSYQMGLIQSGAVSADSGRALPAVSVIGMNSSLESEFSQISISSNPDLTYFDLEEKRRFSGEDSVAITTILADEISIGLGEELRLKWFYVDDSQRKSKYVNFTVTDIVEPTNGGAFAGVQSPAIFAPMSVLQEAFNLENKANILRISYAEEVKDSEKAEELKSIVADIADDNWNADDAGYVFTTAQGNPAISVSNEQGLGRISAEIVNSSRGEFLPDYESVSMIEVIQVPLAEIVIENDSLLSLADQDVNTLHVQDNLELPRLWHFGQTGFGYEFSTDTEEDFFAYTTDDGNLLADYYLVESGLIVFTDSEKIYLHDSSLDEEIIEIYSTGGEIVEVVVHENRGVVKVKCLIMNEDQNSVSLLDFDSFNLSNLPQEYDFSVEPMNLSQSRIISTDMNPLNNNSIDELVIKIEKLSDIEFYNATFNGVHHEFTSSSEDDFLNSTNQIFGKERDGDFVLNEFVFEHVDCNGDSYSNSLTEFLYWCTTDYGIVEFNQTGSIQGLRLGIYSEIEGVGQIGQMFLAVTDGSGQDLVAGGEIFVGQNLGKVVGDQDSLGAVGLIPYAFGNTDSTILDYAGSMSDEYGLQGLSELDGIALGLVNLLDAENLTSSSPKERSVLVYSGGVIDSGNGEINSSFLLTLEEWYDDLVGIGDSNLRVSAPRVETMEEVKASSGVISGTFLIFGGFIMSAGILLIVTITTMLAESRKSDFALLRIFGLKRRDVSSFVMMEGVLVSFFGGFIGSLLGLAMAFFVADGFQQMYSNIGVDVFRFAWSAESIIAGWFGGFLIASSIMFLTSIWSGRLVIVEALRGIKTNSEAKVPWWVILTIIASLMFSIASFGLFLIVDKTASTAYTAWMFGGIFFVLFAIPFGLWAVPAILHSKLAWTSNDSSLVSNLYRQRAKNTFAALGVILLVWCIWPSEYSLVRGNLVADELSMLLLGLVQVTSGVLILTSLAPVAANRLSKSNLITNRFGAFLPVGLSHPKENPFRTAMIIGMFSITVFSVIVLSGYTLQFEEYSADLIRDAEGEYEIILTSSISRPIDIGLEVEDWPSDSNYLSEIDSVGVIYTSTVFISEDEGDNVPYILRGVNYEFASHSGLPLFAWDESLGETEREAWLTMQGSNHIAFVDASFGLELITDQSGLGAISLEIGDSLDVTDPQNPSNSITVQIGGFLEQSSVAFSPGVFVGEDLGKSQFNGEITRIYVSVSEESNIDLPEGCCDDLVTPPGKSNEVRRLAGLLAEDLSEDLAGEGVNAETTSKDVLEVQGLVVSLLSIFESYLLLGLIVGTAGIGVVTMRAVSERNSVTGMLRAIGFTRGQVVGIYLVEIYWICVLGMLNGAAVAIGFHLSLFNSVWSEQGAELSLPIARTLYVMLLGLAMATFAVILPVRRASRITPAAALRSN